MVAIQIHPGQNGLVSAWRTNGKYTFPVLFVPPVMRGAPTSQDFQRIRYAVIGTPTNLLVNVDRKIVFRHMGGIQTCMEAEIRELLGAETARGTSLSGPGLNPMQKGVIPDVGRRASKARRGRRG